MASGDLTTLQNVKAWLYGTMPAGFAASQKAITAISQSANAQVTSPNHGFAQGQQVMLSNIGGMTALSGQVVTVVVVDASNFRTGVDTSALPAYTGGGVVSAEDVLLSRLITMASRFVENFTGRSFSVRTFSETRDGTGSDVLMPANTPVITVTAVTIDGRIIPLVTGAPLSAGFSFDEDRITLTGFEFARGRRNVSFTYQAGYAVIPPEIEQVTIELVGLRYRERERIGEVSKSLGGQETVSYSQRDLPPWAGTVLAQYQMVAPV